MSDASSATKTLAYVGPTVAGGNRMLRLTVASGPDEGRSWTVSEPRVVIGRGESVDARLTDPAVSQFHVELAALPIGISVTDLGSRNGTRCGDVMVKSVILPSGGVLMIGSTALKVELAAEGAPEPTAATSFGGLVGGSEPMRQVYASLTRLAKTDLSILIEGETGTGKEVAARAVHDHSSRAQGPILTLDCTAIPTNLAESTLFGHEKGAFTGATERRVGIFEAASGGTVFLDEVGELPIELQPKLLRVLERREVTPVGSTKSKSVDVRIISATLRDLRAMVNRGAFREDLYYRLAQARVRMPSLDERREDIRGLVQFFLGRIRTDVRAARTIANSALDALATRSFPGNVRELANIVERAALLAEGPTITLSDLAFERMISSRKAHATPQEAVAPEGAAAGSDATSSSIELFNPAKKTVIQRFERDYLERLLERTGTNISRAAALAGIDRHTLRDLLKRHGLRGED